MNEKPDLPPELSISNSNVNIGNQNEVSTSSGTIKHEDFKYYIKEKNKQIERLTLIIESLIR